MIKIIAVGKTKQKFILDGVQEYNKRLTKYSKVVWEIVVDVKLSSSINVDIVKAKESEKILSKIKPNDFVAALDERGKQFTSPEFAKFISQRNQNITFIIGGVYGLSDIIKKRANILLSFSKSTMTHQMIRLLLSEQLYRAFTIITGKKYHY